jgi:ankyrin repeat protein
LVAAGADVNAKNDKGNSVLMFAIDGGHFGVARFLVQKGADINFVAKSEKTPLIVAVSTGQMQAMVRVPGEGNRRAASALYPGQVDFVRFLVEKGASVDGSGKFGYTPLMAASVEDHAPIARYLVSVGAGVNARTQNGLTALQYASGAGAAATVNVLIQNKAAVDATSDNGLTPLMIAAAKGYADIVSALVAAKANVALKDPSGRTAADLTKDPGILASLRVTPTSGAQQLPKRDVAPTKPMVKKP